MITKYGVLKSSNPVRNAFISVPIYFAFTTGILTMLIVWKGAASAASAVEAWGPGEYIGVIFGVGIGCGLLSAILILPYLHRKLNLNDWELQWYDAFKGPLLLQRGEVPPNPNGQQELIQDYYRGHKTREQLECDGVEITNAPNDVETNTPPSKEIEAGARSSGDISDSAIDSVKDRTGPWYAPKNLFYIAKKAFLHGVDVDVVAEQKKSSILVGNLEEMHARAAHYDNKAEHTYSMLQILTAATASFAHGANDVSNAVGPLAAVYLIWSTATLASKSPVPVWIL